MKKRKWWLYILLIIALAVIFVVIKIKTAKVVETVVISFDTDGGSAIDFQIIKKGDAASAPEDPVKEGATFDGWMLGEEAYEFGVPVNESITLKAAWISDDPLPEEDEEKEEDDKKDEQGQSSSSSEVVFDENVDYGLVVNVGAILSGPIYTLGANHPGILGTLKAAAQKGIAEGEIVGISATYPDGTVINTGFVIWTTDITALGSIYLPDARKVLIKGF